MCTSLSDVQSTIRACHRGFDTMTVSHIETAAESCLKFLDTCQKGSHVDILRDDAENLLIRADLQRKKLDQQAGVDRKKIALEMEQAFVDLRICLEPGPRRSSTGEKELDYLQKTAKAVNKRIENLRNQMTGIQDKQLQHKLARLTWNCSYLCNAPQLFNYHPPIYRTLEKGLELPEENPREFLIRTIEMACLWGDMEWLTWALGHCKEETFGRPSPFFALQHAIHGGFDHVLDAVLSANCFADSSEDQKECLIDLAVEMGFPEVLLVLKKHGFRVLDVHFQEMELLKREQALAKQHAIFPVPMNKYVNNWHCSKDGKDNLEIAREEYTNNVGYTLHCMKRGDTPRQIYERLQHRRRRSAIRGNLPDRPLYGRPSNGEAGTGHDGTTYKRYGDIIRERYPDRLPAKARAIVKGQTLELTEVTRQKWTHPDGLHRETIMNEVDRLMTPLMKKKVPEELLKEKIAKMYYLLSHQPPCLRGTPIVLKNFTDALCILQGYKPIHDPDRDMNCEALTYLDEKPFIEHFMKTITLFPL